MPFPLPNILTLVYSLSVRIFIYPVVLDVKFSNLKSKLWSSLSAEMTLAKWLILYTMKLISAASSLAQLNCNDGYKGGSMCLSEGFESLWAHWNMTQHITGLSHKSLTWIKRTPFFKLTQSFILYLFIYLVSCLFIYLFI